MELPPSFLDEYAKQFETEENNRPSAPPLAKDASDYNRLEVMTAWKLKNVPEMPEIVEMIAALMEKKPENMDFDEFAVHLSKIAVGIKHVRKFNPSTVYTLVSMPEEELESLAKTGTSAVVDMYNLRPCAEFLDSQVADIVSITPEATVMKDKEGNEFKVPRNGQVNHGTPGINRMLDSAFLKTKKEHKLWCFSLDQRMTIFAFLARYSVSYRDGKMRFEYRGGIEERYLFGDAKWKDLFKQLDAYCRAFASQWNGAKHDVASVISTNEIRLFCHFLAYHVTLDKFKPYTYWSEIAKNLFALLKDTAVPKRYPNWSKYNNAFTVLNQCRTARDPRRYCERLTKNCGVAPSYLPESMYDFVKWAPLVSSMKNVKKVLVIGKNGSELGLVLALRKVGCEVELLMETPNKAADVWYQKNGMKRTIVWETRDWGKVDWNDVASNVDVVISNINVLNERKEQRITSRFFANSQWYRNLIDFAVRKMKKTLVLDMGCPPWTDEGSVEWFKMLDGCDASFLGFGRKHNDEVIVKIESGSMSKESYFKFQALMMLRMSMSEEWNYVRNIVMWSGCIPHLDAAYDTKMVVTDAREVWDVLRRRTAKMEDLEVGIDHAVMEDMQTTVLKGLHGITLNTNNLGVFDAETRETVRSFDPDNSSKRKDEDESALIIRRSSSNVNNNNAPLSSMSSMVPLSSNSTPSSTQGWSPFASIVNELLEETPPSPDAKSPQPKRPRSNTIEYKDEKTG